VLSTNPRRFIRGSCSVAGTPPTLCHTFCVTWRTTLIPAKRRDSRFEVSIGVSPVHLIVRFALQLAVWPSSQDMVSRVARPLKRPGRPPG
jgi:hypothetical protein